MAINLAVAGVMAAAFLAIASYDRTREPGRWLAAAYLFGITYSLIEFSVRWINGSPPVVAAGAAALLLGMGAFNIGLACRYQVRQPFVASLAIVLLGTLATVLVDGLPRHSLTRMIAYQTPYFAMQAIAVAVVLVSARKRKMDYAMAALLGFSALHFMAKPFIAHAVGGWGENPSAYLDSNYAMVSQALGTVFAIAIALSAMVVLVRDILQEATEKSELDTLSGLHNRRGFERRASLAVERALRQGMPVSLVITDLDHFKSINDSYGHAAGDQVLVAFARFLQQAATHAQIAGRIGGEEFAIMLPGTNLVAARLFAEGARTAFSAMQIDGLPEDRRFTASFGVAELAPGERADDMMRRADAALYAAKRSGRDCVRVSERTVTASPPRLVMD
ncbi:sensor domain-containing diguanylate cyclase [Arvimicrobium flavum]|uniref:GGDEF domain-containing protein n=1 Tax=Arvimicrobium flavum TaxID=3393320 RepID=UPI0030842A42